MGLEAEQHIVVPSKVKATSREKSVFVYTCVRPHQRKAKPIPFVYVGLSAVFIFFNSWGFFFFFSLPEAMHELNCWK